MKRKSWIDKINELVTTESVLILLLVVLTLRFDATFLKPQDIYFMLFATIFILIVYWGLREISNNLKELKK